MNKILIIAGAAVLALSTAASGATFTLAGGNLVEWGDGNYKTCETDAPLTTCYSPHGLAADLQNDLQVFDFSTPPPGLSLTSDAAIKVTYLGKEAGATNRAFSMGSGGELSTSFSTVGDSYIFTQAAGTLNFSFKTSLEGGLTASNSGTPFHDGLSIGFFLGESGRIAYAYFDDSGANLDRDYDDMVVRIEVIPLPAGGLLLLTALGGLALYRRRNQVAA